MKKLLFTLITLSITKLVSAQTTYFPPLTGNTWTTITPASLGWCDDKIDSLYDYLQINNTKAFIVLKDGKIVIEKYFGTFTQDSVWYWASAGKSLTAFMVGIAQQEGKLKLSDTSSKYLGKGWTSLTQAQESKITIRHQLTMTTGLNDQVADPYCTLPSCMVYKADAGTRWAYHNAPYTMLDPVLEAATGQKLNTYISQKLTVKTGISGLFIKQDYNNIFFSKPRSMARYGLLILNKGSWNGTSILTDTAYFRQMVNTSQNLNPAYGYLWWLNGKSNFMVPGFQFVFQGSLNPSAPKDMFAALGKNGQILNIVPSQNLIYVRMGNIPTTSEVPITFNDTIWQKLNRVMCSKLSVKNESISKIEVYPNPFTNQFRIENMPNGARWVLTNIQGQEVFSGIGTQADVSFYGPAGLYFLNIYNQNGSLLQTSKLMLIADRP